MNASEIELALKKLKVLGRVLYIAAHPDDENTNLMALWSNGSLYETAYLSVTRGDGGQNLICPELRERLGVERRRLALRRLVERARRQVGQRRQLRLGATVTIDAEHPGG